MSHRLKVEGKVLVNQVRISSRPNVSVTNCYADSLYSLKRKPYRPFTLCVHVPVFVYFTIFCNAFLDR